MQGWIDFIKNRIRSFQFAFDGLRDILTTEHNAIVHSVFTVLALLLSFWLKISWMEFILIILVISLVWITESFNTVLEIVIDIVSPQYSDAARRAKDIAAAGVLISAVVSFIVGMMIFIPTLLSRMGLNNF